MLHAAINRASRSHGRPRAPVNPVPEDHDGRVLPGHHGKGVRNGAAGVLGGVRMPLVQRDGLARGGVVGPVPVLHPSEHGLAVVSAVELEPPGHLQVGGQQAVGSGLEIGGRTAGK